MKKNTGKYTEIDSLPLNAKTVKTYADDNNISTGYVYKQIREGKNKFKMVVFQGVNFIIPS